MGKLQQIVEMMVSYLHDGLKSRLSDDAHMYREQACVGRKLHIREAVAHHNRARKIHVRELLLSTQRHSGLWFATTAVNILMMRTAIDGIKRAALRLQLCLQRIVYLVYRLHRTHPFANTLLIGNQEYMLKLPTQQRHCLKEMWTIDKLTKVHHVIANELLVHHAIAVHKECLHLFHKARQRYDYLM